MRRPDKWFVLRLTFTCVLWASHPGIAGPISTVSSPDHSSSFACGGLVEQRVWAIWDGGVKILFVLI